MSDHDKKQDKELTPEDLDQVAGGSGPGDEGPEESLRIKLTAALPEKEKL